MAPSGKSATDPENPVRHAVGYQLDLHFAEMVGVDEGVVFAVVEEVGRAGRGDVVHGGGFVEKLRHFLKGAVGQLHPRREVVSDQPEGLAQRGLFLTGISSGGRG
jgi:hypothetical protein